MRRRFLSVAGSGGACLQNLSSGYADAVLADSPVAYWQCQECSGSLIDSSGNSYDMAHVSGSALTYRTDTPLAETDTYSLETAGGTRFESGVPTTATNNVSLEFWIKLITPYITQSDNEVLYNGLSGSNGWGVVFDSNDTFQYLCGGVAVGPQSTALSRDAWHHVVVVRDAGTWKYYIDGSVDNSSAGSTTPNTPTTAAFTGGQAIQRRTCHMAIYDVALTSTQVSDHYNAA